MDRDSKEYFWGCELSKETDSYTWSFEEEEDEDSDYLVHTLFLRSAVLGPSAVKGELNIVQVETQAYDDKKIKQPLFSLRSGAQESVTADITFVGSTPATFRLIEGSGPVHICGQHLVEFPPSDDQEYYTEDEEVEDEEAEEESPIKKKTIKRKATTQPKAKSKKGKMEVSEEEEDEEEDEEEMDDEGEEEELDEDEEEETPKKKKAPKAADAKATKVVRKAKPSPKTNAHKPAARKIRK